MKKEVLVLCDDELNEYNFEIDNCFICKHTELQHFEDAGCFMPNCKCKKFNLKENIK